MRRFALLFAGAAAAALPLLSTNALPETDAVLAGAAYLQSIQRADGTYGVSDPGQNMDSVFAVRAAGYDPAKDLVNGVAGPKQFLEANAANVTNSAAAAKAALAARALGLDPEDVAGTDLIAEIEAGLDGATSRYAPGDDFSHSLAIIGLACTEHDVPDAAVEALQDTQLESGGWGFGGTADPDTTAIGAQALLASGVAPDHPGVRLAYEYLLVTQQDDGGWGYDGASNASSTAFAVQALLAMGEDPESAGFRKGGVNPVQYLLSQQQPNGSFIGFDPTYATNQVLPALAGRTFCNAADTPITRVRPVVVATPTASPSAPPPTATQGVPSATATTQAPRPPAAGTGPATGAGGAAPWLALGVLLAAAGGAAAIVSARRRG